jgi:hypothetical protein
MIKITEFAGTCIAAAAPLSVTAPAAHAAPPEDNGTATAVGLGVGNISGVLKLR